MEELKDLETVDWQYLVEHQPIGTPVAVQVEWESWDHISFTVNPPEVSLYCKGERCMSSIIHACRPIKLSQCEVTTFFLTYACRACGSIHNVACKAMAAEAFLHIRKLGQDPPMGGPLPNALLRLADGKEKQWIERGRSCIKQGHGIAALAYYRLVVEGIVDDLLDKMTRYGDTEEQRALIREAIAKPRLGDKLQAVKDCIPKQMMLGLGQNPITFLYSCFSDELHYDTADDAKALEKATHGMTIVCALLELMQDQDRLGQALKASFKALSDQHSQRKPNDRPS